MALQVSEIMMHILISFQFEKSAQLITIWWGLAKRKDTDSVDFRSDVIYTHSKFLHPSLVLSSNEITLQGKNISGVFQIIRKALNIRT